MTRLASWSLVCATLASVASATPVLESRASTKPCYTTHSGLLLWDEKPFGLNKDNQMIYPPTGTQLNVHLQACPNATYAEYRPEYLAYGARLVVGTNQCLTTLQSPSDSNIYYMHLATCGSNISPPTSQAFVLNNDDFGNNIWHIENKEYAGPAVDDNGPITTSGTHLVKWRHKVAIGQSYTSLVIQGFTG